MLSIAPQVPRRKAKQGQRRIPAVRGIDVTKVIDTTYVQSAKDRKIGG